MQAQRRTAKEFWRKMEQPLMFGKILRFGPHPRQSTVACVM